MENGRREYEEIILKKRLDDRHEDDRYVRRPSIDGYLNTLSSFVQSFVTQTRERKERSRRKQSFLSRHRQAIAIFSLPHHMPVFTPKVDTSKLPQDAMSYHDENFYSLVESLSSHTVSNILKCQAINSINTFLHTRDVLEVLQLPAKSLDLLRDEACLLLHDNTYVVLPGLISSMEYLTELFRQKNIEHVKSISKKKPSSSTSSSSSMTATTIDVSSNLSTSSRQSITLTSGDHHAIVAKTISKWAYSKEKELGIVDLRIEEGEDFSLTISSSGNSATIVCCCGTKLSILKTSDQSHFNLSTTIVIYKAQSALFFRRR